MKMSPSRTTQLATIRKQRHGCLCFHFSDENVPLSTTTKLYSWQLHIRYQTQECLRFYFPEENVPFKHHNQTIVGNYKEEETGVCLCFHFSDENVPFKRHNQTIVGNYKEEETGVFVVFLLF
jgi:hypothetical protein